MRDASKPRPDETPGVHFPPPFLYAGLFALGLLLERVLPAVSISRVLALPAAALLVAAGFGLLYWSLYRFLRARTSPLPMRPTTALVFSGPYRWSRNPMYAAMLLLYLGVALWFDVFWALPLAPLALLLIGRFVIRREERYLEARFGEDYRAYRHRVRRWL